MRHARGEVSSAIRKTPVEGALTLGMLGLVSDEQADLHVHGGIDKALCVYPREHVAWWASELGIELLPGGAGENISSFGLVESDVVIGDVYRIGPMSGEAVGPLVQVSQPRQPCYKLAARHGNPDIALMVQETGTTGFYLRCMKTGELRRGDPIVLVDRPVHGVTIAEANHVMHHDRHDTKGLRRLLDVPDLANVWRTTFERRLAGELENISLRIEPPN